MKLFVFFLVFFFSSLAFAEVEIHIPGAFGLEVECTYDKLTGATVCERLDATGDTPGVWNPKTFSCTNYVVPVVNAAGEITCPPINYVKTTDSTTTPIC